VRLAPFSEDGRLAVSLVEPPRLWLQESEGHWREATGQEWRELELGARMQALAYLAETPGPVGAWAKVQVGLAGVTMVLRLIERPEILSEAMDGVAEALRFILDEGEEHRKRHPSREGPS
jgi:hypothetical protein